VSYARTIRLGYCYLTRLIPRRDLSLFLSLSGTCDTGEVVGSRSIRARALSFGFQSRESSRPGNSVSS